MQQLNYKNRRAVSSRWSVLRCYKQGRRLDGSVSRVEAGWNTSTVGLRVVGGGEKGSLESETVKYDHETHGIRTQQ
jgi:hypothetical protein